MRQEDRLARQRNRFRIGLLIGGFAAADFLLPVLIENVSPTAVLAGMIGGLLAAQLGLLAIWAALGPQRAVVQLPVTLTVLLGLYGGLVLGLLVADGLGRQVRDLVASFAFAPLVFLAVQLPLWMVRIVGGRRIVLASRAQHVAAAELRQFRLRDLLVATAVLAVALGLARSGIPGRGSAGRDLDAWVVLVGVCILCALWSAFSTLPCLWAALVARNSRWSTWAMAAYVVIMTLVVLGVMAAFSRNPPPPDLSVVLLVFHGVLAAVMLGTLHVARRCGYVLLRADRRESATPPEAPSANPERNEPAPPESRQSS